MLNFDFIEESGSQEKRKQFLMNYNDGRSISPVDKRLFRKHNPTQYLPQSVSKEKQLSGLDRKPKLTKLMFQKRDFQFQKMKEQFQIHQEANNSQSFFDELFRLQEKLNHHCKSRREESDLTRLYSENEINSLIHMQDEAKTEKNPPKGKDSLNPEPKSFVQKIYECMDLSQRMEFINKFLDEKDRPMERRDLENKRCLTQQDLSLVTAKNSPYMLGNFKKDRGIFLKNNTLSSS